MSIGMGCDPEFIFRDSSGEIIYANTILQQGDFGMDGHESTGELRPKYANDSLQLVANIHKLIKDGMKHAEISELEMLAGHYKLGSPIGGHIHLSGFNMDIPKLSRYLKLTMMTLSDCIDDLGEREERWHTGYGNPNLDIIDYRTKSTPNWVEFREPGSWLLSPQVAFINLWLAEATSYAYFDGIWTIFNDFEEDRKATISKKCDNLMKFAKKMISVPNQDIFLKVADKLFSKLPLNWDEDLKKYWL